MGLIIDHRMFAALHDLASTVGLPIDLLKIAIALASSLLLSPLFRITTSRTIKNWLSIVIGAAFLFFMIEEWAIFILGSIVLPYPLMQWVRRPFLLSAAWSFLALLVVHGYRLVMLYGVWRADCSVYVMLLATKLTYYGKWLETKEKKPAGFADYLAYNLFFPGVIAGPTFSFDIYLDFVTGKYENTMGSLKLAKALQPLLIGLILSALSIFSIPYFHLRWVVENSFYLSLPFIYKVLLINVVGFFYRLKYYSGWYLAQAATNLSGLSLDAEGNYTAAIAVSLKYQTEINPRTKTQNWNASNQVWLKEVVYEGLKGLGEQPAFLGTFIVSAFWHGLYLSYYVGFLYWGILLQVNKWFYKWSLAYPKLSSSLPAKILGYFASTTILSYIGMFLTILNWEDAVAFHSGVHYWGTFVLLGLLVITFVVPAPRRGKKQE